MLIPVLSRSTNGSSRTRSMLSLCTSGGSVCVSLLRNSISPHDRDKPRSRSPDLEIEKKRRKEDKHDHSEKGSTWNELAAPLLSPTRQRGGQKRSGPRTPFSPNGEMSPRENGTERGLKRERPPSRSGSSSSRSTPSSAKSKDHVLKIISCMVLLADCFLVVQSECGKHMVNVMITSTPVSKPVTPTSSGSTTPSSSSIKPHPKACSGPPYPYALHGGAALAGWFDHPSMRTPGFGSIPGGKPAYLFHVNADGQMQPVPFSRRSHRSWIPRHEADQHAKSRRSGLRCHYIESYKIRLHRGKVSVIRYI
ncbi:transducin-like enhancer protein 3-A [Caerostris extrusa]|uniref:Transducin-like enhancer protein 3-A n=1 Tax=Caerostris extrusa TaxID=172846 RepID=A0AAV4U0R0_CAEEX|nr:transducin-like enhancer protein 3-A [Caerostris extrusa]